MLRGAGWLSNVPRLGNPRANSETVRYPETDPPASDPEVSIRHRLGGQIRSPGLALKSPPLFECIGGPPRQGQQAPGPGAHLKKKNSPSDRERRKVKKKVSVQGQAGDFSHRLDVRRIDHRNCEDFFDFTLRCSKRFGHPGPKEVISDRTRGHLS